MERECILITGLSGSGKTTLANALAKYLSQFNTVEVINGDDIRKEYDDWDFSRMGRIRQAIRMRIHKEQSTAHYVICDFIAPLAVSRSIISPDWIIWMDTVQESQYKDTDSMFEPPQEWHIRIKSFSDPRANEEQLAKTLDII